MCLRYVLLSRVTKLQGAPCVDGHMVFWPLHGGLTCIFGIYVGNSIGEFLGGLDKLIRFGISQRLFLLKRIHQKSADSMSRICF